ncbi:hypothetical protein HMPREF9069_01187 [Atopobium sp. oral taxon 810 str. F0209]|nr:hypothetical protein HMPREF9069_01187 [Atopobium sp. oral taxon 810 str. F0209]
MGSSTLLLGFAYTFCQRCLLLIWIPRFLNRPPSPLRTRKAPPPKGRQG